MRRNTFVADERIVWVSIDGLPIKAWTSNTFKKIASFWGVLVEWEDSVDDSLACKCICIRTKVAEPINERDKIIIRGNMNWIRSKELDTWEPNFDEENVNSSSEDEFEDEEDKTYSEKQHNQTDAVENKEEKVSESSCMHGDDLVYDSISKNQSEERSEDPFKIYDLLKAKKDKEAQHMEIALPFSWYFHGILNSKRSQLAIHGILNDGDWIDDPLMVKKSFLDHFSNRFSKPNSSQIKLDLVFPKQLSSMQSDDLERPVTYDEVKAAVWDCGTNKSPDPDGFSFEFFRDFWSTVDIDVVDAVREFFYSDTFPRGCNSSFIALIPKTQNVNLVKDYRPISLIRSIYKIIAKILANRLRHVVDDLISEVQSAFVS
ncbi:hypothetical protein Tco_0886199 [Tanacetum coccineum]